MISPHTPPGTHVVVIAASIGHILPRIKVGERYVVAAIHQADRLDKPGHSGFGVALVGFEPAHANPQQVNIDGLIWTFNKVYYSLRNFGYAALPECLTELLHKAPAPELEIERRVLADIDALNCEAQRIRDFTAHIAARKPWR